MKLSQYNYNFSPELLAKYPTENRDESRLIVIERKTGKLVHRILKAILDYYNEQTALLTNHSNEFRAWLYGNDGKYSPETT